MPVLSFDDTPKRIILPSTESKSEQGWVEMTTYPLCSDDYAVYYAKLYGVKDGGRLPVLNAEVLARRIKSWNYTDKTGAPLQITAENIGHLPNTDISFLMNKIEDEPTEELDEGLKDSSSPTSSQPPTVTP